MVLNPEALKSYEAKVFGIRGSIELVLDRRIAGLYIWGDGGVGKSHVVTTTLQSMGVKYLLHNSRMSAPALFDHLANSPHDVHVFEDLETMTEDKSAWDVLRSALWSQDDQTRRITWNVKGRTEQAAFDGSLIFTANVPLQENNRVNALASRLINYPFHPTEAEILALAANLALQGHEHQGSRLPPEACLEVVEYVEKRSRETQRKCSIRAIVNAWRARISYENHKTRLSWQESADLLVRQSFTAMPQTREARKIVEQKIAEDIYKKGLRGAAAHDEFAKATGKAKSAWYDRLKELGIRNPGKPENN
ncbi:hypothetical protein [Paludisphaera rhizosphaerae]|uniref:hypothetical protein n=1 Tax=Paludisphaera rhizosphaerae TaxID=2711216 RepID=UPI0013E99FE4|nr:hypothetical protein [Paludisphaera rhizosphaerae]